MFIINKKVCKTPGTRHKQMLKVINNQSMLKNKIIYNINSLTRKKKQFFKRYSLNINKNNLKFSIILINNITYIFKPYKKFFKAYTNTNLHINLPGIEFLNVGKLIYYFIHYKKFKNKFCFKGMLIHLSKIPYTVVFSNLFNKLNAKITYSKSGGTFCKLKKTKKTKKKLLSIVLPSKHILVIPKFIKVYIGINTNFKNTTLLANDIHITIK